MSTLTAFADMSPVPRVLVDVPVEDFPAGSVTVSLQSTVEGRTMRGMIQEQIVQQSALSRVALENRWRN
ncbi:hypothetical protein [Microbacterium paraoxydans]|uniref:hypothetical protein n=1 Tax=Microbacterium paraoxydans TaxID=199592 RepID=UPI003D73693C